MRCTRVLENGCHVPVDIDRSSMELEAVCRTHVLENMCAMCSFKKLCALLTCWKTSVSCTYLIYDTLLTQGLEHLRSSHVLKTVPGALQFGNICQAHLFYYFPDDDSYSI